MRRKLVERACYEPGCVEVAVEKYIFCIKHVHDHHETSYTPRTHCACGSEFISWPGLGCVFCVETPRQQRQAEIKRRYNDKKLAAALRELEEYRELGTVDSFRQ